MTKFEEMKNRAARFGITISKEHGRYVAYYNGQWIAQGNDLDELNDGITQYFEEKQFEEDCLDMH